MDWDIKIVALATTKKTPIMLTSHTYWNLDGFSNNETNTVSNHSLHMPYGGQRMDVDNILIPTGDIIANKKGSVNDFWSKRKMIGDQENNEDLKNNCGFNCTGYDTCYTVNRGQLGNYDWRTEGPVASLSSAWSGIQVDIYSDQDAFQFYSCTQQKGDFPLKRTQGLKDNKDFLEPSPSTDVSFLRFRTTLMVSTTLSGCVTRSNSLSPAVILMFSRLNTLSA
ncbi:hypothetical protein NXS19_002270 [Fusarium pseudograminearum]|nr:hypothetical protein NXS19_002270 [Fusarium pseudograminearum]